MRTVRVPRRVIAAIVAVVAAAAMLVLPRGDTAAAVVNGGLVRTGDFPSTAYLLMADGFTEASCGGTLVAPSWVLTAAHCTYWDGSRRMQPSQITVVLGRTNIEQRGGELLAVTRIERHPRYDYDGSNAYDVALLRLATPSRQPVIRLATTADAPLMAAGVTATLVGWGDTDAFDDDSAANHLRYANMTLGSETSCKSRVGRGFDASLMICKGDGQADACHGDSGGPLMVRASQTAPWTQIGIVSFGGKVCGRQPAVYTKVSAVSAFITATIGPSATPLGRASGSLR